MPPPAPTRCRWWRGRHADQHPSKPRTRGRCPCTQSNGVFRVGVERHCSASLPTRKMCTRPLPLHMNRWSSATGCRHVGCRAMLKTAGPSAFPQNDKQQTLSPDRQRQAAAPGLQRATLDARPHQHRAARAASAAGGSTAAPVVAAAALLAASCRLLPVFHWSVAAGGSQGHSSPQQLSPVHHRSGGRVEILRGLHLGGAPHRAAGIGSSPQTNGMQGGRRGGGAAMAVPAGRRTATTTTYLQQQQPVRCSAPTWLPAGLTTLPPRGASGPCHSSGPQV